MKELFEEVNLRAHGRMLLDKSNKIIREYSNAGYTLTLRQLYYQLVSRDIIPNQVKEYSRLGRILVKGRMGGLVDWGAIEDRVRVPYKRSEFSGLKDLVEAALRSYRLDRWKNQESYVELWVEKDALSGVLKPMADKYHVTLMVNKGYSSASAMYDAHQRIIDNCDKECTIFYLGDFDPSGEDMVRDIEDRLRRMDTRDFTVEKIGLNPDQIKKYKPPPNPAKMTDPRAKDFVAKYGATSWEVDALEPKVLHALIEKAIKKKLDRELMDKVIEKEEEDKEILTGFVEGLK